MLDHLSELSLGLAGVNARRPGVGCQLRSVRIPPKLNAWQILIISVKPICVRNASRLVDRESEGERSTGQWSSMMNLLSRESTTYVYWCILYSLCHHNLVVNTFGYRNQDDLRKQESFIGRSLISRYVVKYIYGALSCYNFACSSHQWNLPQERSLEVYCLFIDFFIVDLLLILWSD